jgi:CubicO group peptidase (beta-lactamase class C family)
MKAKSFSIAILVLIIQLFSNVLSNGQEIKLTENEINKISEMMEQYKQLNLFSGVVLIMKDGEEVYKYVCGFANNEEKIKNGLSTQFRLASISKLFTTAAVLRLYDDGKLDVDDKIGKYLNLFTPDISEKVTIRQLINMSAGFGNYLADEEFKKDRSSFRKVNDLLRIIKKEKLAFEPGTDVRYSNSGYVVLGAIIEKVTGKDYFDYVKESIFIPCGMENTYFPDSITNLNEAILYKVNSLGEFKQVLTTYPATPAGNAVSTVGDLYKFTLKICTTNDILSDKSKDIIIQNVKRRYKNEKGDWITSESKNKVFGWTGSLPGISTILTHDIQSKITLIILSNWSDIAIKMEDDIASIALSGISVNVELPFTQKIYKSFCDKGIEFIKSNFSEWTKNNSSPSDILNIIGYDLMAVPNVKDAIKIFKLNTELFPNVANTWDSIGEAYLKNGQKQLAIESYKKALAVDPNFESSINALKELEYSKERH